ncbi:glycerophosphodiester phosphodiesterase [Agarivorans sp. B2Z047]|uniref:glycerophosphodiester phosphodiesterase family protein n=1 Tax=Agarivorans sp. B2Z047 TaxID=2652721 RepID=UPI00128BB453|nr:glycerophosphodiester phosphodiesterase family protein [Agarivorans sp. B2Z047]MPW27532.1 glycerophosphodiester phosphodiesterase [Agarivorans sp. B2Z047]UQN44627.1 glycerophosphodiester phosphodiesterase [Agarivorans sp. B2Z047]
MKFSQLGLFLCPLVLLSACSDDNPIQAANTGAISKVQLGPRPAFLVDQLADGELKTSLQACVDDMTTYSVSDFSIGHRGAPLMFPEHTKESYMAAARMGAGVLECDVAFTKDGELVCRHSHADLHTTTNVLAVPELAAKCSVPFTPADTANGVEATAECRTSDFTLAEYKSLTGKMDAANKQATTVEEYMDATPSFRTDLYAEVGTLMSHKESIALFKELGVKMTPELKTPAAQDLAAAGITQQEFAQKMIDEYIEAGIEPSEVYAQSFSIDDVEYWVANTPEFGEQAVYLIYLLDGVPSPTEIAAKNINIVAPIYTALVEEQDGAVVATDYAKQLKEAGLDLITWTIERKYTSMHEFEVLNVLKKDLELVGVFSDWPATVTFFDNCIK